MQQLKIFSRNIVISGTLLIWIIKFIIRPFELYTGWMQPLVGFAPNLIGSFLLPFGACWFFRKHFLLNDLDDLKITCWFGLLLVVMDEYLQLIPVFGRTFDYLDILSSFIGVYAGYNVFAGLMNYAPRKVPGKQVCSNNMPAGFIQFLQPRGYNTR